MFPKVCLKKCLKLISFCVRGRLYFGKVSFDSDITNPEETYQLRKFLNVKEKRKKSMAATENTVKNYGLGYVKKTWERFLLSQVEN